MTDEVKKAIDDVLQWWYGGQIQCTSLDHIGQVCRDFHHLSLIRHSQPQPTQEKPCN